VIRDARQRLIDTAARLLSAQGVERVNTNQIARAAGVGVGTFYAHFNDKYDLHRALVLHAVQELTKHLARAPSSGAEPTASEVRTWVDGVLSFGEAHPQLFAAAFGREARPAPGMSAVGLSVRPVERRLEALRRAGELDPVIDPAIAARGFAAMLTSLVCWWLAEPSRADRAALVETLVHLHPALAGRTGS
jgi:AcrR family transcriptional regulator